jgi:hypothetical protein
MALLREVILSSATRGTLTGSGVNRTAVESRLERVPWQRMEQYSTAVTNVISGGIDRESATGVTSQSDAFISEAAGATGETKWTIVFDLETFSRTSPPMKYVADYVAANISARLNAGETKPSELTTICNLSPLMNMSSETSKASKSTSAALTLSGRASRTIEVVRFDERRVAGRRVAGPEQGLEANAIDISTGRKRGWDVRRAANEAGLYTLRMECRVRVNTGNVASVRAAVRGRAEGVLTPDGKEVKVVSEPTVEAGGALGAGGNTTGTGGRRSGAQIGAIVGGALIGTMLLVGLTIFVVRRR